MSADVVLCECFARDGLQHEADFVATDAKVAAINAFAAAGFPRIEVTSYSHPKHVPAFADGQEVLRRIDLPAGVSTKATCPNLRAVERALMDRSDGHGASEFSLLVSATEAHTQKNLRTDRATQWRNVTDMARAATEADSEVRLVGVISVAFGCPFEGAVDEGRLIADAARFVDLGARHLTIGDTTGLASPRRIRSFWTRMARELPEAVPIAHFHDSRGTGLANCMAALEAGCTWFDSAMGGTGGHPAQIKYGGGFTGNICTEDLVNLLEEEGVDTGLDFDRLATASRLCEKILGRELRSMVARSGSGLAHWGAFDD
ncbi:hydroxymethylglutaryl-CoA lyase [Pseudooceanicola sp.]|uniref:hydroxymethylglutaryl-CoA lyase n=1 Tax=Pseudooceanicola sp. TaxID=1914328 RepID=UPI002630FB3B|nr:hydroxymethylglutaryl-CoA lyase [Pseudooceanicola sp.]MDF1856442.1 hydroxymethylglutaryl-CoA lyase [Pseudooceanicola sp.]